MTLNSGNIASLRSEIAAIVRIAAVAEALGVPTEPAAAIKAGTKPAEYALTVIADLATALGDSAIEQEVEALLDRAHGRVR